MHAVLRTTLARECADGVRVQAARPRRGPHRGRGRPLARRGRAGDRRGRPARRDPDRQGDRRDPLARRGHRARGSSWPRARSCRSARCSSSSAATARDAPSSRPRRQPQADPVTLRGRVGVATAVRARPRSCAGSRRSWRRSRRRDRDRAGAITEEDVRAPPWRAGLRLSEGRREPLRGVRRVIAEHMARAHREVPAVTWVEECDFEDGRPRAARSRPSSRRARTRSQEFPELNARLERRRDRLPRPLRHRRRGADRRRGSSCRSCAAATRRPSTSSHAEIARARRARARAGTLAPEELRGSTFTVTSAGKLGGLFQTPIVNHPEVGDPLHRAIAARPGRSRRRDRRPPDRHVAVTFDHRVVDGARAAAFGLAVIGRLRATFSVLVSGNLATKTSICVDSAYFRGEREVR